MSNAAALPDFLHSIMRKRSRILPAKGLVVIAFDFDAIRGDQISFLTNATKGQLIVSLNELIGYLEATNALTSEMIQ